MRRNNSGVAVVALLVGVAVAAVVYIASFGKSSTHADAAPQPQEFRLAPEQAAAASATPDAHTAAR